MEYLGESFLNKIYKDLHMSDEVMHTASKSDSKNEKVSKYLSRLENVEKMAVNSKYNGLNHLKKLNGIIIPSDFECDDSFFLNKFTIEDLKIKSLENSEFNNGKHM